MSKIIVIIGAPGAGKGTQSRLLSEKYGYPQISTGDILREMARADTPLGRKVKETMAAGRLVSDEILAEVIRTRLRSPIVIMAIYSTVIRARSIKRICSRNWPRNKARSRFSYA
jgi:adenylate kinase family enzyme